LTGDIEKDTTNGTQLFIANSLWAQKEFKFLKAFIDLVETNYNPILKNVDFTNNIAREDARKELNKWVEQKTNDKINELLKQGDIDASTKLILVNAIYFKAAWDVVFDKSRTENKTFYLHSNDSIQVPIMHKSGDLMYYENADMQVVDIPYKEDKLSMMIFLPWEKEGFEKMENLLNKRLYTQIIDSLGKENVDLSIPQFTTTFDFKLDKALPVMGMPLAFSGKADFSGMTGRKDLYISHVIHKAFINVNESGTEAAAATVVIMRLTSRRMETSNTKIFNANHPFIFLIKDNTTGSILFMGKTMNPEKD
jgi:serpin B